MDNLYDILEVSKKASKEVIEKAYKTLAKKYHPDLQDGEEAKKNAEEKMKKINEAYEILIDDERREEYNREIENKESQNVKNNIYNEQKNTSNEYDQNYSNENNNQNNNVNNSQVRYTRKFQSKEKLIDEEQRNFEEEIKREKQRAYNDAYNQYLRSMGFRIRERWTLKKVLTLIITILVLIAIAYILWLIPPIKNKVIEIYQQNPIIKMIIDVFISLIKSILDIFKRR